MLFRRDWRFYFIRQLKLQAPPNISQRASRVQILYASAENQKPIKPSGVAPSWWDD